MFQDEKALLLNAVFYLEDFYKETQTRGPSKAKLVLAKVVEEVRKHYPSAHLRKKGQFYWVWSSTEETDPEIGRISRGVRSQMDAWRSCLDGINRAEQ